MRTNVVNFGKLSLGLMLGTSTFILYLLEIFIKLSKFTLFGSANAFCGSKLLRTTSSGLVMKNVRSF